MSRSMAKAVWTGSLSFGLVNIPVKLFNATSPRDVRFHQFQRDTGKRVRYRRVAESAPPASIDQDQIDRLLDLAHAAEPEAERPERRTVSPPATQPESREARREPEEVRYEDIVKGFEVEPDRYVMVNPSELRALEPERSRTIEIEGFVDLSEIDPVYFEKSYYLAPQRGVGAEKPYSLLLAALNAAGKVGIARFVLRSREYLAAIRPMGEIVALETLFFSDEVRRASDVDNVPVGLDVSERELAVAEQLIGLLSTEWDPSRYRDAYRERVLELIDSKAGEEQLVSPPPAAEDRKEVADLMAALKASVEAVKKEAPERRKTRRRTG